MSELENKNEQTKKDNVFLKVIKAIGGFFAKHFKLIIFIVIVVAVVLYFRIQANKAKEALAQKDEEVLTASVEKLDLQNTVSVTGSLKATENASVTSTASGKKVDSILFEEGDYVEAGTVVVTFTSGDDDYEKKLAELDAKYALADVKNGKAIIDDQQAITDTQKEIEDLQEDMEEIQKYLDDNEYIYNNLCDARDEWIEAQKNYSPDSNPYLKSKARYDEETGVAKVLADPVTIEIYEKKQDDLEDFEDKLEQLEVKLATANYNLEYEQLQQEFNNNYTKSNEYEQYDSKKVVAPISGYITAINVTEGNNYMQGTTVFTISDTSDYIVEASVDEYDVASLQKDQKCVVKFDATEDEEFTGKVTYVAIAPASQTAAAIASNATAATGMAATSQSSSSGSGYTVKIALDKNDERLRMGMTAKASVILETKKDALAVAYDCIEKDEDGNSFVTQVAKDGTEKKIPVKRGMETDFYVEISGQGIKEGLTVKATPASSDMSAMDKMMMTMGGAPAPEE